MGKTVTTCFRANSLCHLGRDIFGDFYFEVSTEEHTTAERALLSPKEYKAHIS
jgi:hypothetical protein